jgi:hypothetical protein
LRAPGFPGRETPLFVYPTLRIKKSKNSGKGRANVSIEFEKIASFG